MVKPYHRTKLGDRFSEGARLLWAAMAKNSWSLTQLAEALNEAKATTHRVLYGDRVPSLEMAAHIERLLSIRCQLWFKAPKNGFSPPGSRNAA